MADKYIYTTWSPQSVLGQRDDFPDVWLLVALPSAGQLDFGTVEEGITHHSIFIFGDLGGMAVDGTTGLRVTHHTSMVNERRGSLVRLSVELDQHPLDVEQVSINSIQEPSRLKVLRRSADRNAVLLDDISNAISLSGNWSKAKQAKGRVTTVRGGEDGSVQDCPSMVGEDGG